MAQPQLQSSDHGAQSAFIAAVHSKVIDAQRVKDILRARDRRSDFFQQQAICRSSVGHASCALRNGVGAKTNFRGRTLCLVACASDDCIELD